MVTARYHQLDVAEIFRFADGRTVFVGSLDESAKYIPPCEAELVVNDRSVAVLRLEGEMMTDRQHPMGYRSVSTTDSVDATISSQNRDTIRLRINLRSNGV